MAGTVCALVPEEQGILQHTEKGRGHSKKGYSASKGTSRAGPAPEAGRNPLRAGAQDESVVARTDTRKGRVHSLARNGAGTSLSEGTQGSGHGEESWKGHCGAGPKDGLGEEP